MTRFLLRIAMGVAAATIAVAACSNVETSGPGATSCPTGQLPCAGACIEPQLDPDNCGSCGNACPMGQVCSVGACAENCGSGTDLCGELCVDFELDPDNCGSCGNVCPTGELCSQAMCGSSCGGGTTQCGDVCVDTEVDPNNCGGCDNACMPGELCVGGSCSVDCPPGYTNCGVCIDTMTDTDHCGGCASPCGAAESCEAGMCRALYFDCASILAAGQSTGDGVYLIDPDGMGPAAQYTVHCDMTSDGGGWTLLGTVSGADADNWNTQYGYWSDMNTLGNVGSPFLDFKSQAWIDLDLSSAEIMFQRRYDGNVKAQTVLANACLFSNTYFYQLFETNAGTRCARSNVNVIMPAMDSMGLSSASYQEGVGTSALGGSSTNGWCWNGGDNNSNVFRGHAGWNQSSYTTCVAAGHLAYVGVWTVSSTQYTVADITGTNWLSGTNYALTDVSFFAR